MRRYVALLLLAACNGSGGASGAAADEAFVTLPAGASVDDVLKVLDSPKEALQTTGHKTYYFVVLRDGDRHGTAYRQGAFHAVLGAGLTLPEGALAIRRVWAVSGQIDGTNEQPEVYGISVAVEPGASKPYSRKVLAAAEALAEALSQRIPLHPDCVLAMEEIAYTNQHPANPAERELAKAARARVTPPAPDGRVVIRSGDKEIPVDVERRKTSDGIAVGMMFRKAFDGKDRGMLFEYPFAAARNFWMKNCPMPIDLAYVNRGRIEQVLTMEPGFGIDQRDLRYYESSAVADMALEMPAGWFEAHGVKPGDTLK
ncbi:MAG TPA: DUF192 domain-containing protein [Planctomycetota bacterium]|nr:DUF192 domain-containing protein [Planctomycetota bacterium]